MNKTIEKGICDLGGCLYAYHCLSGRVDGIGQVASRLKDKKV